MWRDVDSGGDGGGGDGGDGGSDGDTTTVVENTLPEGDWYHTQRDLPSDLESLTITLDELTADQDLYVRLGEEPNLAVYDCRPWEGNTTSEACVFDASVAGQTIHFLRKGAAPTTADHDCKSHKGASSPELCTVPVTAGDTVHIGVLAYSDLNFSMAATSEASTPNNSTTLALGESVTWRVTQGEMKVYSVSSNDADRVAAVVGEHSSDIDLYIRIGQIPTTADYACKSDQGGTQPDGCAVTGAANDTVYIGVHGYPPLSG